MHSVREVRDTFAKIIDQNKKAIRALDQAIDAARAEQSRARKAVDKALTKAAMSVMQGPNFFALSVLHEIAQKTDIAAAYGRAVAANDEAKKNLATFISAHGDREALESIRKEAYEISDETGAKALDAVFDWRKKADAIEDAASFTKEYPGKPGLTSPEGIAYFSSKPWYAHVAALMFDRHYREGRRIIKAYTLVGVSLVAELKEEAKLREDYNAAKATYEEARTIHDAARDLVDRHDELKELISTPEAIKERMAKEVVKQLNDQAVLNAVYERLPELIDTITLQDWAKAEAAAKVIKKLEAQKKALTAFTSNLEAPMYKLNRGVSHGSSTKINIDLDKLSKGAAAQCVAAGYMSAEMKKAIAEINRFSVASPATQMRLERSGIERSPDTSMTDMLLTYMMYSMVFSSDASATPSVDPAAINAVFDLSPDVCAAAGIDISTVTPQIDVSALGGMDLAACDVHAHSPDFGSIDLGSIDIGSVDVGSVDVGHISVDVPSFDIPDTSPTWDGGGGGDFSPGGD